MSNHHSFHCVSIWSRPEECRPIQWQARIPGAGATSKKGVDGSRSCQVAFIRSAKKWPKRVADLSPLLACSILLNSVQQVPSWVAVGAGWLSTVAWVNIGSYYLVVIPIGVVLGYVLDMHLNRVWVGMLLGTLLQTVVLIVITCKTDWDKHVVLPRNRVNKWFVSKSTEENGDNTENIVS
ncbi:hypothetical protein V6N13_026590 [Hibiscus sabdariffa]